jgi:hypothetical protein
VILKCYDDEIFDANLLECIYQIPETTTEFLTTSTETEITTQSTITTATEIQTEPSSTTRTEISTQSTTTEPKNPCEGISSGKKNFNCIFRFLNA